jgi:hypothetical protein
MVEVLVVGELLRPLSQEVYALPSAQSIINQPDILKWVPLILTGLLLHVLVQHCREISG